MSLMPDESMDHLTRIDQLENAIRKVRDDWQRGDMACWKDLVELFQVLPEGYVLPERNEHIDLEDCKKYIGSCYHPDIQYVSPRIRIEELEKEVEHWKANHDEMVARNTFLRDRPDLPEARKEVYDGLVEIIDGLKDKLNGDKDVPLSVDVEGEQLVVRVGLDVLVLATEHCPRLCENNPDDVNLSPPYVEVVNRKELVGDIIRELTQEDEAGLSPLMNLFDDAIVAAFNEGSIGFAENGYE